MRDLQSGLKDYKMSRVAVAQEEQGAFWYYFAILRRSAEISSPHASENE
jgi:hypothetical protein